MLIFWTTWTSIYGPNYSTSLLLNLTELDFDLRKLIVYIYFLFHLLYISSAKLRWRLVNKVKTTKQLKKLRWNGKNSSTQKLIVTLKKRTLIDFVAHYARNRRGICFIKNFTYNHVCPGYTWIEKDSINSHCLSEWHKEAANIEMKSKFGATPYMDPVIWDTPTGQAIKRMCNEDKNVCPVLFNSPYYLAKQERPFSDFSNLLKMQEKNKTPSIKNCYRN